MSHCLEACQLDREVLCDEVVILEDDNDVHLKLWNNKIQPLLCQKQYSSGGKKVVCFHLPDRPYF